MELVSQLNIAFLISIFIIKHLDVMLDVCSKIKNYFALFNQSINYQTKIIINIGLTSIWNYSSIQFNSIYYVKLIYKINKNLAVHK